MTHDYAKKKPAPRKKKKTSTMKESKVPGWVWLFTGIVTGVFISFLAFLADITPTKPAKTNTTANAEPIKESKPDSSTKTTRFDFYTLLPEREMIVPTQREDTKAVKEQAMSYILQAGSFRNGKDADRLRARLILMGLDAKVEEVTVKSGGLWHRVQVGPFDSRSKLAKARSTLVSEGIDTLLLKKRKAET